MAFHRALEDCRGCVAVGAFRPSRLTVGMGCALLRVQPARSPEFRGFRRLGVRILAPQPSPINSLLWTVPVDDPIVPAQVRAALRLYTVTPLHSYALRFYAGCMHVSGVEDMDDEPLPRVQPPTVQGVQRCKRCRVL